MKLFCKNALIAGLLGLIGSLQAEEMLVFPLLPEWDYADSQESPEQAIIEFVGRGEDIEDWSRLLTVITHARDGSLPDLHSYYDEARARREAICPGMTEWTLIKQSADSILYESRTSAGCQGHAAEYELVRLLAGAESWFKVSITLRGIGLSKEARNKWIELLEVATIKEESY